MLIEDDLTQKRTDVETTSERAAFYRNVMIAVHVYAFSWLISNLLWLLLNLYDHRVWRPISMIFMMNLFGAMTAYTAFRASKWIVIAEWAKSRWFGTESRLAIELGILRERAPSLSSGRPPANWWPAFSEELAMDLHDNGFPETQEALIDRVFSSMAERGKPEPSRTTVQPLIRALYARRAQAGN